jgi:hypothetical protein
VSVVDSSRRSLVVDFVKEGRITLPAAYIDDGHLDYGYARTTYGVQGATLDRALYYASDQSSFEEGYVALTRGRTEARIYIVDGKVVNDEEGAHRGHDPDATGLDTVAGAMERRRANRLAHEQDGRAAAVAGEFDGWTLRQLADERRRLKQQLSDAPPDVSRALVATNRHLDGLRTRRHAWEELLTSADDVGGILGKLSRRSEAANRDRATREMASIDLALARTEQRASALREQWASRHAFFRDHSALVDRLGLVTAAERAAELKVRTNASLKPPDALLESLGGRPNDHVAAQLWRNAVEDAAVYVQRFGRAGGGRTDSVSAVLGGQPQDVEAAWGYQRAADSINAFENLEPTASVEAELEVT